MEEVLEEIKKLSKSVQSIQDDIKQLSDKFEVHMKTCPSIQYQIPCMGELGVSHLQGQGHSNQGQSDITLDVLQHGQVHHETNEVARHLHEHPKCDQGHDNFQGHCKGQVYDNTNAVSGLNNTQGHSEGQNVSNPRHKRDQDQWLHQHLSENGDGKLQTKEFDETECKYQTENTNDTNGQLLPPTNKYQYGRRSMLRGSLKQRQRQCMRLAIQQNILLLLDHLPFVRGDLLDRLIEKNCLTDNECTEFTDAGNGSGKDKVRNMMRIIRGRSYEVMDTFLKCLETVVPHVVLLIRQSYQKCLKDKQVTPLCTICLLKQSVDVQTVGDVTWSARKITDTLYDEIVIGKTDNEVLWHKFATECNSSNEAKSIIMTISNYLKQKGHYNELVNRLSRVNALKCQCVSKTMSEQNESLRMEFTTLPETDSEDFTPSSSMSSLNSTSNPTLDSEFTDDDFPNLIQLPNLKLYSKYTTNINRQVSLEILEGLRSRSNSFGKSQYTTPAGTNNYGISFNRRASMFV